ncbi:MAG: PHB depolymerase family esterase, partial [Clostridiales bacterium]|nr:PHB depolymerase family esterase [Clostridiales bacterium]
MKGTFKKLWLVMLTVFMLLALGTTAFAAKKVTSMQDIDAIESLSVDLTQAAQIPMEGWYEKTLESGRTVKMYVPTYASCRAYFTVVTVPNGISDAAAWAKSVGFTKTIADRGEVLIVLEPQNKKWKSLEKELAYVTEAMSFVAGGKNAAGITLFSNYSTYYLAGFGAGAAPLEAWSAKNPILVGAQVFVNGKSAGKAYLSEVGAEIYDGTNTGGYDPGIADLDEFTRIMAEHGYTDGPITKSEVAVPTWFINYSSNDYSVKYWKSANDTVRQCQGNLLERTYWQDINSDAFQTEYANSCTDEKHGISAVKISYSLVVTGQKLGNFLYKYSRYNIPFAYSNHLSERQDYTGVRVAAQKAAQTAEYLSKDQYVAYDAPITSDAGVVYDGYYVLAREQAPMGEGTVESGIFASSDDDGDGVLDAHEYLMYVPDCAKGTKAPVVMQFPGNTQSVSVGFDSTQWWRIANDYGVVVIIVGETYQNKGSAALTWKNADMSYYPIVDILKNKIDGKVVDIDWERIYGSGHSAGSATVQTFVHTHPEYFAAVASTSFGSRSSDGKFEAVPAMLLCGQSDLPFLMDDLWTSAQLKSWFQYLAIANNLKVSEATTENCDSKVEGSARTWTYTWNNRDEIPMVVWGQTYLREHNCYPAEIPMSWDFLKNYRKKADGSRYYKDQLIVNDPEVSKEVAALKAEKYGAPVETDTSQGTLIPYNGYYYGEITEENGDIRVYKEYIPEGLHRSMDYEVLVTIPENWNTERFLVESGWLDLADEYIFNLFILEPGKDGWGTQEEEAFYIDKAFTKRLSATTASSVYVAAYGKAGSYLQQYLLKQPMNIASAAFIDANDVSAEVFDKIGNSTLSAGNSAGSIGATESEDNTKVRYNQIPVPVWIIEEDLNDAKAAVDYWKGVNKVSAEAETASVGIENTKIYKQTEELLYEDTQEYEGKTYAFAHNATPDGLVANVLTTETDENVVCRQFSENLYKNFLCKTFRYGSTIWSNILIAKPDYESMGVDMLDLDYEYKGNTVKREFMVYQPKGFEGKRLPVVYIFPGGNQSHTNLFNATGWYRIAEENGIIIVAVNGPAPFASVTGACSSYAWGSGTDFTGDEIFMEKCMAYVNENYPTDTSRVYSSGLWNYTKYAALNHPEIYAAQGNGSAWGTSYFATEEAKNADLATFTMVGENDYDVTFIGDTPAMVKDFIAQKGYAEEDLVMKGNIMSDVDPRYMVNEYYLADENGEAIGEPIIRWGWVYDRGHSFLRTDYEIIWKTWFSHWRLDETTGEHIYEDEVAVEKQLSTDDIESIKAYTDMTMYGVCVKKVVVKYKEGTDLSEIDVDSYVLEDRGSLSPDFGKIDIADVSVEGNKVVLEVKLDSDATEANKLI